jgi:hypothetical protein
MQNSPFVASFRPAGRKEATKIGLAQAMDSEPFVGHFSPRRAKNDLQKKKSTMLPQARSALNMRYVAS